MTYIPRLLLLIAVVVVVGVIVVLALKWARRNSSGNNATFSVPTDAAATATGNASYGGTTTIFINGGAPASGNAMGKISVDGNSMSVFYSDLPLEITIPAGKRHVVVEGGRYGDARIDRIIDFDTLDVWTVDMPGGDDADVIRHQMISYSQYRQALSDYGYRVTKKKL